MLIQARRWDAEHGFASVVPRGGPDAARWDGWFLAVALPSAGETLSWLRRSPFMLRL
jgi:hypothetical protein